MDLKELIDILRRRWLAIVSMIVLAVAASVVVSLLVPHQSQSRSRVFISTDVRTSTDAFAAGQFTAARVKSYAALATSRPLLRRVVRREHLEMTPQELAGKISTSVETDTVIIDLVVRASSAELAQRIATAVSDELTTYLGQLETPLDGSRAPVRATVVDTAPFRTQSLLRRIGLNVAIGALLGLLMGIALAVIREQLDNRIEDPGEIEEEVDAPILTDVPFDPEMSRHPLITDPADNTSRGEAFRVLRTNLQFRDLDEPPEAVVITSSSAQEGKTSIATNLAIASAQAGLDVLLVDADLRQPEVDSLLGLEQSVGLTTVLVGRSALPESLQRHSSGIQVLTSGPLPPNPTEVLQSETTARLFADLRSMFDLVIVDAPPLLPMADAAILARYSSGAVIVVRHGRTTREALDAAAARLRGVGGRILGVVLNMSSPRGYSGSGSVGGHGGVSRWSRMLVPGSASRR